MRVLTSSGQNDAEARRFQEVPSTRSFNKILKNGLKYEYSDFEFEGRHCEKAAESLGINITCLERKSQSQVLTSTSMEKGR